MTAIEPITVTVTPDMGAFEEALRRGMAATLRRLADEIDGPEKDAPTALDRPLAVGDRARVLVHEPSSAPLSLGDVVEVLRLSDPDPDGTPSVVVTGYWYVRVTDLERV